MPLSAQTNPDLSTLLESLGKYESCFNGRRVVTDHKKIVWGHEREEIWVSKDGNVQVIEWENVVTAKSNGKKTRVLAGIYNTPVFSFDLRETRSERRENRPVISATAVPEYYPEEIGTRQHAILFGYSQYDAMRFSQICNSDNAQLSLETFEVDGTALIGITCEVSGLGNYRFGFERNGNDYRLVYFEAQKGKGDVVGLETMQKVFMGSGRPRDNSFALSSHYKSIWYPIRYDGHGFPQYATFRLYEFSRDVYNADQLTSMEVLEHEPHDRVLDPNRISFVHLKLPNEMEVQPYRSGIPLKLVNGRLVTAVDGISLDQIRGVGFREPSWSVGYLYYVVIATLLLAFGGLFWYLRRRQMS